MSKFMTSKEKKAKQRHQIKSRWYYIFWGTATVAVCAGQLFVGSGFRRMAESFDKVLDSPIRLDLDIPEIHQWERHPMLAPKEHWHEDSPKRIY